MRNEGGNTFNAFDVIGHLIQGERTDWMPRAKRILQFGESRDFDRFDRRAQQRESQGKSLPQLLDEFARVRAENLVELRALNVTDQELNRRGVHPELGTVCWPDGADLDPDVLYAKVSGNPIRLLTPGGSELEPASLAPRAHGGRIDTIGLVTSLFETTAPCRTYQRSSTR